MRFPPTAILFLLLLGIPLIEIYLLISVGRVIGAGPTILAVIATAVAGTWLLRIQGLGTLARVQAATRSGQLPAAELVEGLILLVAGVLLLTPGFFTDTCGFLLLIPAFRQRVAHGVLHTLLQQANVNVTTGPRTIEGDFRHEDPP